MEYNFKKIEKKWQKKWEEKKVFEVKEDNKKKKYYVLEMYPYPSASFLHMGHVRNFTIGDIYARFKRMQGYNVLYPMGFDSFGLPAETAAKKEGIHPRIYAEQSIKKIMEYFRALGNSYDWSKTLASHEPEYYKWNQYFFLKFFEKDLAYRKKAPVNWCIKCESVLANEEAEGGKCWRCGEEVVQKETEQWFFRITKYADRLLDDLNKIEWHEKIKKMQTDWIGKSHGTKIYFDVSGKKLPIFTTRPDTIFGVTFLVISAKHPELTNFVTKEQKKEVEKFLKKVKSNKQEDIDKLQKEGVFTGSYAKNPMNGELVPLWIGNFVVADYGSGVVMAVPAHDQRDFEFAKKYKLKIRGVILPEDNPSGLKNLFDTLGRAYTGAGKLFNSKAFDGLDNEEAKVHITKYLEAKKLGGETTQYKLRDWMISRQRYWGTPIPVIYCDKCGIVPVPEKDLPVLLPEKVDFKTNANPLSTNKSFVNVKCPKCGKQGRRETDTMGGFMDSSWYFLRYCDNKNKKKAFDEKKVNYWMPVDQYIGGAEHAVMHLMYARFFTKALKDLGFLKFDEPFLKLFNQGIVYKDGAKMSKSKGNVVFQTDISDKYGIDTARLFLMSVSSPDKQMEWSDYGVEGSFRFINKLIRTSEKVKNKKADERTESKLNIMIKKATENIETFDYPKSIISCFEFLDYFSNLEEVPKKSFEDLLKILSPFIPHVTEELWEKLGNKGFISLEKFPIADEKKINEKLEQEEKQVEKLIEDINNIIRIIEARGEKKEKIYAYILPNERNIYNEKVISKRTGKEVKIFLVNDKNKYDPTNKSKNSKPGKPAIYLE